MTSTERSTREPRPLLPIRGLALALLAGVVLAAGPGTTRAQEGEPSGSQPVYRAGLAQEFSTALDSAPRSVTWKQLREQVAIRLEGTGGGDVKRHDVVFHALLLQDEKVKTHHTSESVELLPGATKFDPDGYLPEKSMIPDGFRIADTMGFGVVEIPPGKLMSSLLRDIIMPMTEGSAALYLLALPPEDQRSGTVRAYPILIELAGSG